MPFFPEVHEELTKLWMAPFTARSRSSASSILTTRDGGVARGNVGIPQVERVIAVHLCPRNAATWRNRPRLPSKACKLTAALPAKAYSPAGQAAYALHAMAILQIHQAKALTQVHEGSTDLGLVQELRTATDFALRATKVTAQSLGKAMSTMVVQERHLWLNLADMKDVDKARFLDAPISQAGLFGDTVESFAQQFSVVQQQTEAIQHTCPGVMHHPPLLPFAAPPQVCRLCRWSHLHSVWRRGSRCPACLAGSRAQFDSATRFSSPGDLPSSTAFSRLVAVRNAPVLRKEIAVLLAKDAIEPVPPAERRQGFYSPYFIIPKKRGGLRPILDLRVLNRALHKLPFKMRTRRRIIKCIQPQD